MIYKIFKIKPNKKDKWLNWCNSISNHRRPEAIQSLKEEENTREINLIIGDYVIYGIEGKRKPQSNRAINIEHRRIFNDCLDSVLPENFAKDTMLEIILDIDVREE